ncbi:hypothetical protein [Desulfosporosinus sp. BICA1-9]|uniref:hypothetical protein n=1 Tax=Desulfosporosinus sp. BICA1-9 TaxID=1531958 RepID=UPI00054B3535|nr:hypothetical protein [Desulfosporosinus sp. BICA1-9]KJS48156.1 MAG: hypothetical protein VR66_15705 [Peptococcaceae bacterium BRH_c23]KJS78378.1 MAG: hypothetical protein JL57_31645 [Desulfosporosinus sp. BICA1-9]HBW36542.1 hypothetical protein [Desulfosporosinus sp.]
MFVNSSISLSEAPLNLGISIFAPISSATGSGTLFYIQPLLAGSVCEASLVMIIAELLLYITKQIFRVDRIPVLDVKNGQIVQMPLTELQEFLKWMTKGTNYITNSNSQSNTSTDVRNLSTNGELMTGQRGLITPESLEAPLVIAISITGNYADLLYSPAVSLIVPVLKFPGLRGSLPLLILGLIATIFIRSVVTPDLTGAETLTKSKAVNNDSNRFLNLTPNDLLEMLSRFGKHFGSK